MFTGIVTDVARVRAHRSGKKSLVLTVEKPKKWRKIILGESIATNGVCLTVSKINNAAYDVVLMAETLSKTTFGIFVPKRVNLERSLVVGDRLGGHMVTGHIDTIGRVASVQSVGDSKVLTISFPKKFRRLLVAKGSVSVDGVSLTVVSVHATSFSVSLVSHTLLSTTLGDLQKGSTVNLEFDILAKYALNR